MVNAVEEVGILREKDWFEPVIREDEFTDVARLCFCSRPLRQTMSKAIESRLSQPLTQRWNSLNDRYTSIVGGKACPWS
jgi:hypothetical protein